MNTNAPAEEQALQGDDYLPTTSSVVMADNVTFATIPITILHVRQSSVQLRMHDQRAYAYAYLDPCMYVHLLLPTCLCLGQ